MTKANFKSFALLAVVVLTVTLASAAWAQQDAAPVLRNLNVSADPPRTLMSVAKPIIMLVLLGVWAWAVSFIDKDLEKYYLHRAAWNGLFIGTGTLAIVAWLFIPLFWLGIVPALVLLSAPVAGYILYRNPKVPPNARWSWDLKFLKERLEEQQRKGAQARANILIIDSEGQVVDVPMGDDPFVAAHEKLGEIMEAAFPRDAERVDLVVDAQAKEGTVHMHVDGVRYAHNKMEGDVAVAVVDYVKTHAGLDISDRRRKQHGKMRVEAPDMGAHTIEVSTAGSTRGLQLTMRIDPGQRVLIAFDDLGLLDSQKQQLLDTLAQDKRVVLVVCPPHMGMRTTLLSLVHRHDPYTQHIYTYEDEVHVKLEAVNHQTIDVNSPELAQQLKGLMLREPEVVMISQLSDPAPAKIMSEYAVQTSRFYAGLRQKDSFTALKAWVNAIGEVKPAADALAAIIGQRLMRKLCPTCKVPYTPDAAVLKKLNLSASKVTQLYKSSGKVMEKDKPVPCPTCHGLGFRGRIAVYEVLAFDDQARKLIAAGELDQLRSHLRKHKALWLQEAALARAVEGVTSISEITRVLKDEEAK